MASSCNISVVVVSHDRPEYLKTMLACLRLQDVVGFETIVVTNTPEAVDTDSSAGLLTAIPYDVANIAAARNIGIEAASGDFIAFCDDDALPDPVWLRKIMAPLDDPQIGGVGGFTRGRNGICLQWGAVLTDGLASEQHVDLRETTVFEARSDVAPVMIGTNCAFRRTALQQIRGFDEAFAYFLDDSDISLRLSQAGWKLAIVPDCQVHHSFAPSARRSNRRVPKSLEQLGLSKACFCKKHGQKLNIQSALNGFRQDQNRKLMEQFLLGNLDSNALAALSASLERGFEKGSTRDSANAGIFVQADTSPHPVLTSSKAAHIVIAGRQKNRESMTKVALALSEEGHRVTIICLSRTALFMQVRFLEQGFWYHRGGQFGRILRHEPLWRWSRFKAKVLEECLRLSEMRPIDFLTFLEPGGFDASLPPQKFGMSSLNGFSVPDDSLFWLVSGKKL